jgi:hypothetical protein
MQTEFSWNLFNQSCGCIHSIPSSSLILYLLLFPNFLPIILFICLLSSYRIRTGSLSSNIPLQIMHSAPCTLHPPKSLPVFLYLGDRMIRIPLYDFTVHVSICNYNWRRKGNVTTVISNHECCTVLDGNLIYSILNIFNSCLLTPAYLLSCSYLSTFHKKKN